MIHVRRLLWDPLERGPHRRHQVTPDEVEEICHGQHIGRVAYTGRIMVIGPTQAGRMLSVVLEPVGNDVYYVVTARPASHQERRLYQQQKGGQTP